MRPVQGPPPPELKRTGMEGFAAMKTEEKASKKLLADRILTTYKTKDIEEVWWGKERIFKDKGEMQWQRTLEQLDELLPNCSARSAASPVRDDDNVRRLRSVNTHWIPSLNSPRIAPRTPPMSASGACVRTLGGATAPRTASTSSLLLRCCLPRTVATPPASCSSGPCCSSASRERTVARGVCSTRSRAAPVC